MLDLPSAVSLDGRRLPSVKRSDHATSHFSLTHSTRLGHRFDPQTFIYYEPFKLDTKGAIRKLCSVNPGHTWRFGLAF